MNFEKFIIGMIALIVGIILFIWITNARQKGDKGGYGAHLNIYTAAIGFFILGLLMMIRELLKLY